MQEFWVGNEELVNLYDKRLGDAGYINFKLGRTNNRGDGRCYLHQFEILPLLGSDFCQYLKVSVLLFHWPS